MSFGGVPCALPVLSVGRSSIGPTESSDARPMSPYSHASHLTFPLNPPRPAPLPFHRASHLIFLLLPLTTPPPVSPRIPSHLPRPPSIPPRPGQDAYIPRRECGPGANDLGISSEKRLRNGIFPVLLRLREFQGD
jgi:hypothetical protein